MPRPGPHLLRQDCDGLSFRDAGLIAFHRGRLYAEPSCWSKLSQFRAGFPTYITDDNERLTTICWLQSIPPPISLLLCRHIVSRETGHLGNSIPPPNPVSGIAPSSFDQFGILLSRKHQEDPAPAYADTVLDRLATFQIVECASVFGQLEDLIRRGERERAR